MVELSGLWDTDWFESAPVGFLAAAPDGRVLRANPALLAWLGHTEASLAGLAWPGAFLTPAGRVLVHTHHVPVLATGGRPGRIAVDLLRRDGSRFHVLLEAEVHGEPGGGLHHRMTFVPAVEREVWERDLVEARRLAEDLVDEMRELNQDLERRVAERTELQAQANRDLDAFVRTVAHDLRNPLQALVSLGDILTFRAGPTLAEEDRQVLARIVEVGATMGKMVEALLQLAVANDRPLRKGWVDLSAAAGALAAEYQASSPGRETTWEIQPGLRAWGDPGLLDVVLRNLLGNAFKYSSRRERAHIAFREEPDGFCVRDNGAGFDAATAAHLFQPFHRFHAKHDFPGQGIGLATVKRIVDRHGGTLWAESAVGQGAAFRFRLPGPEGEA